LIFERAAAVSVHFDHSGRLQAAGQDDRGQERGEESRSHAYTMSHPAVPLNPAICRVIAQSEGQPSRLPDDRKKSERSTLARARLGGKRNLIDDDLPTGAVRLG
jgi:hypothetical protein